MPTSILTLVLYAFLTTAMYYLGARAVVTSWLWSRYPGWLDKFMLCSACSGFWYGIGVAGIGWALNLEFLSLPGRHWLTVVAVGLCSMIWTPIFARWHIDAIASTAVEVTEDSDDSTNNKS